MIEGKIKSLNFIICFSYVMPRDFVHISFFRNMLNAITDNGYVITYI